jgi:hypothetical protein
MILDVKEQIVIQMIETSSHQIITSLCAIKNEKDSIFKIQDIYN